MLSPVARKDSGASVREDRDKAVPGTASRSGKLSTTTQSRQGGLCANRFNKPAYTPLFGFTRREPAVAGACMLTQVSQHRRTTDTLHNRSSTNHARTRIRSHGCTRTMQTQACSRIFTHLPSALLLQWRPQPDLAAERFRSPKLCSSSTVRTQTPKPCGFQISSKNHSRLRAKRGQQLNTTFKQPSSRAQHHRTRKRFGRVGPQAPQKSGDAAEHTH